MKKTIFSPCDILLPEFGKNDPRWTKWSVIACDQFTSEAEYWREAEQISGDMSTLSLILPEAYLETDMQKVHEARIAKAMTEIPNKLRLHENTLVYLERTLPDGKVRRGLVGTIDLEEYDYGKGSLSPVRATEATVVERIPPREAVRRSARVELPHVMLLTDGGDGVFEMLEGIKESLAKLYDFDLMLGGGHAVGYAITGDALDAVSELLAKYEASRQGGAVYAIGDGNHSLAAAKAHYEHIKSEVGEDHPARWALAEVVSIEDCALEFEPIYRLVSCERVDEFLTALDGASTSGVGQKVTVITASGRKDVLLKQDHALTVGTLQNFIDTYSREHGGISCDYIHDESSLITLASKPGNVGFLFDGMSKSELFPYVEAHGALPRKTFSMGEARSKRYYLEARSIVK